MKNTITELGKRTNSALQAKLAENYKLRTDLEKYCFLITVNSHNVPHHIIIVLNHIFLFFLSLIFKYSHISADIVCVLMSVCTGVTSRFISNCKVSPRLSGLFLFRLLVTSALDLTETGRNIVLKGPLNTQLIHNYLQFSYVCEVARA